MKVAAISGVVMAALAAGAIATPSFAQSYGQPAYGYAPAYANDCRQVERSNGAAGTILGGIAGAVLGSNLASHHGGRAGGAALGGVAGALIGNSIGRSTATSCGYQGYNGGYAQPAYASGYYAQPTYGDYGRGYETRYVERGYDRDYRDHRGWGHDRGDDRDGGRFNYR